MISIPHKILFFDGRVIITLSNIELLLVILRRVLETSHSFYFFVTCARINVLIGIIAR